MTAGKARPRAIPDRKVLKWCVLKEETMRRRTRARFLLPFSVCEINYEGVIKSLTLQELTETRSEELLRLLQETLDSLI
jgi:hypothetical protein